MASNEFKVKTMNIIKELISDVPAECKNPDSHEYITKLYHLLMHITDIIGEAMDLHNKELREDK